MTKRKNPPNSYETFPSTANEAAPQQDNVASSPDKTRSAAEEARRLAQGSWADNLMSGRTPSATLTPTTSTEDGSEEMYAGEERNPYLDPPPMYTPSATTDSNAPPSPATIRATPVQVGPSGDSPRQPSMSAPPQTEAGPPQSRESEPLLEHGTSPPTNVDWPHHCKRHRIHRLKKACWLTCAVVLCLWLMIPALINHHNARTHGPPWHHHPSDPLESSPIPSWPHPHREYRRHETSNSIHGTFQLYDLLDLSTTSGSISVIVNPQEGSKPGILRLSSSSGSISVRSSTGVLGAGSNRTFITQIQSNSGSVSGSLVHGNGGTTDIRTNSASISIDIDAIGVGEDDHTSKITTTTSSGSQTVNVRSSNLEKVKAIQASHIARGSAGLSINYPAIWEGKVHLKSYGSGSVYASGSGLKQEGGGRDIYAWRGEKNLQEVEVLGKGSGHVLFNC